VSQVSPGHKNDLTLHVSGAIESLAWAQEQPEQLWLGARNESTVLSRPLSDPWPVGVPSLPAGHPEGWADALRDLLRSFYAAVAAGMPAGPGVSAPYPNLADGARSVAFVEAVVESARSGRWVDVRPIEASPESRVVDGRGLAR
jgi:predicted dehydrogenase